MPGGIEVEGLSRAFGDRSVLHDLTLTVEPGEVVAVVGGNGSGKTTLLRILAGLLEPDAGSVRIAGDAAGEGRSGFVPAGDRAVHWRLSGRRTLAFQARLAGVRGRAVTDACERAAEQVGASPFLDQVAGSCSTGQRRRLMLAQALVACPPVLLLDEPLEDLDPAGAGAVTRVIHGWVHAGGSVLLASPDVERLPDVDRTLVLGDTV
jgi:ABC-2 type transport system ATP-binding protein